MRKGMRPGLVLTNPGASIFALGTGSDATAEHEWGMLPILQALTDNQALPAKDTAELIKRGKQTQAGSILQSRRLSQNLDYVRWIAGTEDGQPVAALVFADWADDDVPALNQGTLAKELSFGLSAPRDQLAGAWDAESFAFKVKGQALVEQLREFYDALQAGDVMFAGTFLDAPELSGIILCRISLMNAKEKAQLAKAQAQYEEQVALYLVSREKELMSMLAPGRFSYLHIWPKWAGYGTAQQRVRYLVNSGRTPLPAEVAAQADPEGGYAFEVLQQWLQLSCASAS